MNEIIKDKQRQINNKIAEIFDESRKDYISNLNNEQKYKVYTKDINLIDFSLCLFLLILPGVLVHYTIPDIKGMIMQTLFNVVGYSFYFSFVGAAVCMFENSIKKERMKRISNLDMKSFSDSKKIEDFEKKIDEAFMDLPADNNILRKFKENYGSENLVKILKEKNGDITNREIKKIIAEQEETNKYREIVDSL